MNSEVPLKETTRDGLRVMPSFTAEHQQVAVAANCVAA